MPSNIIMSIFSLLLVEYSEVNAYQLLNGDTMMAKSATKCCAISSGFTKFATATFDGQHEFILFILMDFPIYNDTISLR